MCQLFFFFLSLFTFDWWSAHLASWTVCHNCPLVQPISPWYCDDLVKWPCETVTFKTGYFHKVLFPNDGTPVQPRTRFCLAGFLANKIINFDMCLRSICLRHWMSWHPRALQARPLQRDSKHLLPQALLRARRTVSSPMPMPSPAFIIIFFNLLSPIRHSLLSSRPPLSEIDAFPDGLSLPPHPSVPISIYTRLGTPLWPCDHLDYSHHSTPREKYNLKKKKKLA